MIAARAMAPGVILLSFHLIPAGLGLEWVPLSASEEGPNKMTFNIYALSAYYVVNALRRECAYPD